MGIINLAFVELRKVQVGKTTKHEYRYTHDDNWYPCHKNAWGNHLQYFRGYPFGVILTQTRPAKTKSGASFTVLGVLAILTSHFALHTLNSQYWQRLAQRTTDHDKALLTLEFAQHIQALFEEADEQRNFYTSTLTSLTTALLQVGITQQHKASRTRHTTLQF